MINRRISHNGKTKRGKRKYSKGSAYGSMYYISIPLELMRKLKWREWQKVVVDKFGKRLKIKDWVKKKK